MPSFFRRPNPCTKPAKWIQSPLRPNWNVAADSNAIGGPAYIGQILETVPHQAHARYYAEIVREKANRRELDRIAYDVKNAVKDPGP